jgi:hypothetical protein
LNVIKLLAVIIRKLGRWTRLFDISTIYKWTGWQTTC